MKRLLAVGGMTLDREIVGGHALPWRTGGASFYSAWGARATGLARPTILTSVGTGFDTRRLSRVRKLGIRVKTLASSSTVMRFELVYRRHSRRLKVLSRGPDVGYPRWDSHFDAIHLCPVLSEVLPRVTRFSRKFSPVISVDLQGFLREVTKTGRVKLRPTQSTETLEVADIYKASFQEAKLQTGRSGLRSAIQRLHSKGRQIVVVTHGAKGAVVSSRGKELVFIPAYPVKAPSSLTGAGDVFQGAFLATFEPFGKGVAWAGCVGSAAASVRVESPTPPPTNSPIRKRIFQRAAFLLARCKALRRS